MAQVQRLAVEWLPIDRVFLSPSNPRHNDAGVDHVAASLRRFGWQQPIVAKRTGEVIAGNTRLKAAKALGMTDVPVAWFDGTDLDATAFQIADNRVAEYSSWNDTALAEILKLLRAEDALEGVGYDTGDIDQLLKELDADAERVALEDQGAEEPPIDPVSKLGDLWHLGDHRLLCGDSTSAADLARLMNGDVAAILSTDPPYAVSYTGNDRPIHDGKPSGKDWSALYNEVGITDLFVFLDQVFAACLPHVAEHSAVYLWHAHPQYAKVVQAFEKHDLLAHQQLIWVKPSATFGHSYYRYRHEPCLFGWRRGFKPEHGYGDAESVWEADWDGKARISTFHPTSKPTRLFEIPMEQHTPPGAVVLEPFSGSGSQLIAAEKLRRKCRAMELQPAFVDGTILRWQKATGKLATIDGSGETYAQVAAARGKQP